MPHDFKCLTDAGFQVLFDPGAVTEFLAKRDGAKFDALEGEVKAGRLAARSFGDGEAFFRVFLDGEQVPRSMEKRAGPAVRGLLLVPTGKLCFAPLEALTPESPSLELAPGRYELTLREMQWAELVESLAERAARKTSHTGSRASDVLGTLAGCFVLLTGVGAIAALVAVLDSGWDAWSKAWPWLLGVSGALGAFVLLLQLWPGAREALAAQQAMHARFPTTLVTLRRLDEGDGPTSGCLLDDHT